MRARRLVAVPIATLLVGAMATPLAIAQDTATGQIVHRESVLTELSSTGSAGTSRVFTQVTMPSGEVVLPGQSTRGLRGLSGPAPVRDGDNVRFTSDGPAAVRTVADHTADLPVSVEVSYAVDGEQVEPGDVVGRDGEVSVTYVVRNLTAEPTELTLVDGDGNETTETVDVAVPMVGSLALTLPAAFTNVTAPGAVVVGNGRGATVVSWSLLLFAPLGSETQEVTWTAQARDAVVPDASLQVVPVTPDSFGSLASTEAAYAGAVDSTTELTEGAHTIDANLRQLVDGAARLLDGLTRLRDGAGDLTRGLVDAASGAGELSDGLGEARTGAGTLSTGLGELASGAGRLAGGAESARNGAGELSTGLGDLAAGADTLSDGLAQADAGGGELANGLGQLSAGAGQLAEGAGDLATGAVTLDAKTGELVAGAGALSAGAADVLGGMQLLSDTLQGDAGLPAAIAGVTRLRAGIGDTATTGTLLNGLTLVSGGLATIQTNLGTPADGPTTLRGTGAVVAGGLTSLDGSLATVQTGLSNLRPGLADIAARANAVLADPDSTLSAAAQTNLGTIAATATGTDTGVATLHAGFGDPLVPGVTLRYSVAQLSAAMTGINDGLTQVSAGIGDPATADTLRNGVARITAGVSNPTALASNPTCDPTVNPANPCGLLQGLQVLQGGLENALTGVSTGLGNTTTEGTLLWGAGQVAGGSSQLSAGATQLKAEGTAPLAVGAGQVSEGATQVAEGAAAAAVGGEDLTDGLGRLAGGGMELAAGAARAAAGSTTLADGLGELDAGADQLADGASRAASGSVDLSNGLVQLDDGGGRLADGLVAARKGSRQLYSGLTMASAGGKQLSDGSEQLAEEGTSVLAGTVSEATISSSLQLEQVRAVAARGVAGDGLPYPSVEGAVASAVYQFDLAGVGATDGPGVGGQLALGLVAMLLALGAAYGVRRRVLDFADADVSANDRITT